MKKIALALVCLLACSHTTYVHGIPNFVVVDAYAGDPYLVRSGQIETAEGWDYLRTLAHGRTVHDVKLNFDREGSDGTAVAYGFDVHYLPIQPEGDRDIATDLADAFKVPDAANIAAAKQVLRTCHDHPLTDFCELHCTHGHDRTGEVAGEYRVDIDGWTKQRAYAEMLELGYHPELHGLHERWEHYQP